MLARIKRRLRRFVTFFTKIADYRVFKSLDGVGSFHKDELYRFPWINPKQVCVSPSGRFIFILLRRETAAEIHTERNPAMVPGGLTTLLVQIVDTRLATKYIVKVQDLWQMNFSYVLGFYALGDSTLVILDQNIRDNTLRQRVISIQHSQCKTFCCGHRGFRFSDSLSYCVGHENCVVVGLNGERAHVVLFAKDPSNICSRSHSPSVNISDLVLKLDEFVSSKEVLERICSFYKFFSHGDAQLCFFIVSADGRLVVTDEGKMKCACVSLSDETMTIREIQMSLKMKRPPDNENSIFCMSKRASSNVICASISVVFPVPIWLALLAIGSRLLTCFCFIKYIYKSYIWDVRYQPSTNFLLSLPATAMMSMCLSFMHSMVEFEMCIPRIITRTCMLDTRSWRCMSVSDEKSAYYSMLAEVTNEIVSVAMEKGFLSVRVRSNPIGNCCTLASLAEQRIKTFSNKAIKRVYKILL